MKQNSLLNVKNLVLMGMFGAVAAVLMLFEFPLPFIAPSFYGLDISEVPILIGTFTMGPVAGGVMELVKILVKLLLKPTSTGFVGELANFCVGCSLVIPAGVLYRLKRTKKGAVIGMVTGTAVMTAMAIVLNVLVMLPFYSTLMPLDTIIAAGAAINPAISNEWTFGLLAVGPFNLIKGLVVCLITALVYKRVSIIIHSSHSVKGKNNQIVKS